MASASVSQSQAAVADSAARPHARVEGASRNQGPTIPARVGAWRFVASETEDEMLDRFRHAYAFPGQEVFDRIEREVIGVVYQANGYTTRSQANNLIGHLQLASTHRLLDVGAGCGWPSLYMADRTGCRVVLTDPVAEGLPVSMARAHRDGLAARADAAVASGEALPFRASSFDSAVHTDVLC